MYQMTDTLEQRVDALEDWRNSQDRTSAVNEIRRQHMDSRFDAIDKRLDQLDGHLSRVVWIIVVAIITSFMTFILKGGLVAGM